MNCKIDQLSTNQKKVDKAKENLNSSIRSFSPFLLKVIQYRNNVLETNILFPFSQSTSLPHLTRVQTS